MNFLFLADEGNNLGQSWPMLLMLVGLLVLSVLMTVIPQRKRRKQMMEMMQSIKVGDQVKSIGGMIGKIVKIDDELGAYVLNVGTDEAPTYIVIEKSAVYVPTPVAQPVPETTEESAPVFEEGAEDEAPKGQLKE